MPQDENRPATLAECNALLHRQMLPQTFGSTEEKTAAKKAEGRAETEAAKTAKDLKAASERLFADLHSQRLRRLQAEQGVVAEPPQALTVEQQAALDQLNAAMGGN